MSTENMVQRDWKIESETGSRPTKNENHGKKTEKAAFMSLQSTVYTQQEFKTEKSASQMKTSDFFHNSCVFEYKEEEAHTAKENPCNSIIMILNDSKEMLHVFYCFIFMCSCI